MWKISRHGCWKVIRKLWRDTRGSLANRIAGLILGVFIAGSLLGTAITMLSNASNYGAGVPATVVTVFTVALPTMVAVALMLYFLPNRT